jgi:DNA-binding transcriptional LysR family regulator
MMQLDLNLLYTLVALGERRSVSRAALQLGKSQPAVSLALNRLRTFFQDPLFVRSGNSMQPTPRAVGLIQSARSVLARVGADIVAATAFDPKATSEPVSLALSDVGEMVFLPAILRELRVLMPNAPVRSVSRPPEEVAKDLESGAIDLAIGYFPDLKKRNFYQQALFSDTFASLVRSEHPVAQGKLNLRQYLQLEHAVVRAESRSEEVIERYLARKRIRRRVALTTPHFASVPMIVAQSDLIVTIPQPLARYFSTVSADLRVVGMPFEPPRIVLKQFWHRKFHEDPRNRWLRALVFRLFQVQRDREELGSKDPSNERV